MGGELDAGDQVCQVKIVQSVWVCEASVLSGELTLLDLQCGVEFFSRGDRHNLLRQSSVCDEPRWIRSAAILDRCSRSDSTHATSKPGAPSATPPAVRRTASARPGSWPGVGVRNRRSVYVQSGSGPSPPPRSSCPSARRTARPRTRGGASSFWAERARRCCRALGSRWMQSGQSSEARGRRRRALQREGVLRSANCLQRRIMSRLSHTVFDADDLVNQSLVRELGAQRGDQVDLAVNHDQ